MQLNSSCGERPRKHSGLVFLARQALSPQTASSSGGTIDSNERCSGQNRGDEKGIVSLGRGLSTQTARVILPNAGLELEMGRGWIGGKPIVRTLRSRWI